MTVNQKITSLLSAANAKTGAGDSDLTGAVGTLIDGYGQGTHSPTISVAANGIITASCGGSTTTHQLTANDDADFVSGNIKDGVTLFGLLGTLSGGSSIFATGVITVGSGRTISIAHNLNTSKILMVSVSFEDGTAASNDRVFAFYCVNPHYLFDLEAEVTMPASYTTMSGVKTLGDFGLQGPFGGPVRFSTADKVSPTTYGMSGNGEPLSTKDGGITIVDNNELSLSLGAYLGGTYRWRVWAAE